MISIMLEPCHTTRPTQPAKVLQLTYKVHYINYA